MILLSAIAIVFIVNLMITYLMLDWFKSCVQMGYKKKYLATVLLILTNSVALLLTCLLILPFTP